jgi:hypothetical protein
MLNSHRMFFERNRSGALRKFPVVCEARARDELAGHGHGEAERHPALNEGSPRQAPGSHLIETSRSLM